MSSFRSNFNTRKFHSREKYTLFGHNSKPFCRNRQRICMQIYIYYGYILTKYDCKSPRKSRAKIFLQSHQPSGLRCYLSPYPLPLDPELPGISQFRIQITTLDPSLSQPFFYHFFQHLSYRFFFDSSVQFGSPNQ